MAQASKFTITTSSESVGVPECIADKIYHLAPWETKLLTALGLDSLSQPCTNPVYKYQEIQETPARSTLNGAINNSTTTVVITDAVFEAGEIVQVDEELILLGTTSDNLTFSTCTRSAGTGAAAAHLTLAPVVSVGKPRAQGAASASTGNLVIQPNQVTNYTQIFSKDVIVSGTSSVLDRYGREGTEYDYQALRQMKTVKKELENAVMWGYATAAATTATAGQMDGIYERIQSTSSSDLSDAALSQANVETGLEAAQNYGGMPGLLAVGLYTSRVINAWGQPYVQHVTDPNDPVNMTYGVAVDRLHLGGQVLNILVMDTLHAHAMMLDNAMCGVGPLQGRDFYHELLAKDGDRIKGHVVGEYTCEVGAPRAHYMWTSVKFS